MQGTRRDHAGAAKVVRGMRHSSVRDASRMPCVRHNQFMKRRRSLHRAGTAPLARSAQHAQTTRPEDLAQQAQATRPEDLTQSPLPGYRLSCAAPLPATDADAPAMGLGRITAWLSDRHHKGWANALASVFALWWGDKTPPEMPQVPDDSAAVFLDNASEWLLARGEIQARGEMRNLNSYLLGSHGPYLNPALSGYVRQVRIQPLRLYQIVRIEDDRGCTLVDVLEEEGSALEVAGPDLGEIALPGVLLGTRLLQCAGDANGAGLRWTLSASRFLFRRTRPADLIAAAHAALRGDSSMPLSEDQAQVALELVIARRWLAQEWVSLEEEALPEEWTSSEEEASSEKEASLNDDDIDAVPNNLILDAPAPFVTDSFAILDEQALQAALGAQPALRGSYAQRYVVEFAEAEKESWRRVLLEPVPQARRIDVVAISLPMANRARAWFEEHCGDHVRFEDRQILYPGGLGSPLASAETAHVPKESLA